MKSRADGYRCAAISLCPIARRPRSIQLHFDTCYSTYLWLIDHGESKEKARLVLPLALYKEFIWTVNARSLLNFIGLRTDPEAQEEIRLYAEAIEEMLTGVVPTVIDSFNEHGRRAP